MPSSTTFQSFLVVSRCDGGKWCHLMVTCLFLYHNSDILRYQISNTFMWFVCLCWGFTAQSTHSLLNTVSLANHTFHGQQLTSIVHIHLPETDNCPSWISTRSENGRRKYFMINLQPPDHQSAAHPTEPPRPVQCGNSHIIPTLLWSIQAVLPSARHQAKSRYHIRPNNRTVRLGFSKLLWKLVLNYVSTYHK